MADEQTDITKGEPLKDSSASSAKPIASPDAVAEAFATFEKTHERHTEIPVSVQNPSSAPVPSSIEAPVVPTPIPPNTTPAAPVPTAPSITVPTQIEALPPEEQLVIPPQFVPPPEPAKTTPIIKQGALISQTPPSIIPEKPIVSVVPTAATPVVRTPTPIVPASFPIAPIAPAEKLATPIEAPSPVASIPEPEKTPSASLAQKTPPATEAPSKVETPQKIKPAAPTMVETLRAQASTPLHPLRTLRSDVESTVKEHKTSIVSVAAAEENRRASGATVMPLNEPGPVKKPRTIFLIVSAVILLLLGGGLLTFVFIPKQTPTVKGEPQLPASTLISVDEIIPYALKNQSRASIMTDLVKLREGTALSLGLIREIYPTVVASTTEGTVRAPIQTVMNYIAPHAGEEFLRTLNEKYVLGIHVFDGNQAFLVLTTSSYEQTFAGMVAWEPDMVTDLLPLFERRPRPRAPNERLSTSTTPSVINTEFSDAVIENHDTRVRKDADGNIILLWTFINQNTLVITTNDRTLTELVTRVRNAPTLGL